MAQPPVAMKVAGLVALAAALLAGAMGVSGVIGAAIATLSVLIVGAVERCRRWGKGVDSAPDVNYVKVNPAAAAELELLHALTRRPSKELIIAGEARPEELAERELMAVMQEGLCDSREASTTPSVAGSERSENADHTPSHNSGSPMSVVHKPTVPNPVPEGSGTPNMTFQQLFKRHRFKPTVSCCYVRDMMDLDPELKAQLWWQQSDFAEFLRTRVAIGRAYRDAAKRRGVHIGSEFPKEPEFRNESRRGLGLGRKSLRDRNRKAYIQAVLEEQQRQREDASDPDDLELNTARLAEAARKSSEHDRQYAHEQALRDYRITEREMREQLEKEAMDDDQVESRPSQRSRLVPKASSWAGAPRGSAGQKIEEAEEVMQGGDYYHLVRGSSFLLPDEEERSFVRSTSPGAAPRSKGFGLSREDLAAVGLSVTGHLARGRTLQRRSSAEDSGGESDGSCCMSDMSDMSDAGEDATP